LDAKFDEIEEKFGIKYVVKAKEYVSIISDYIDYYAIYYFYFLYYLFDLHSFFYICIGDE